MTILRALILGMLQGLSEFLPISSSAHLTILPQLLSWPKQPLSFDTTLHLGTVAALILFFWRDLISIYSALLTDALKFKLSFSRYTKQARFAFYLLLSTVPATIIGITVGSEIEDTFSVLLWEVVTLTVGTAIMFVAEYFFSKSASGDLATKVNSKKSLFIGFMQSLAIFPGISRSGATISGGMFLGLSREEAAKFSFLASVPIVLEAGIYQIIKHPEQLSQVSLPPILIGFFASFIVGVLVIKFLMNFLKTKSLKVFIWYRVVLTVFLVGVLLLR